MAPPEVRVHPEEPSSQEPSSSGGINGGGAVPPQPRSLSSGRPKGLWASARSILSPPVGETDKRKLAARQFSQNFKTLATNAHESSTHGGSEGSFKQATFRRVQTMSNDPMGRQPRSYVEFYKVITRGHREGNPFIDAEVDPLGFQDTVTRLRRRLSRDNRWLLNPSSRGMQYWDMYMLLLLAFTALVTPYEICMMWQPTQVDVLFIVNWLVNLSFMLDIILNFFLPYRQPQKQGGALIKNHARIARHYLLGWFLIDIMSIIPIDTILMVVAPTATASGSSSSSSSGSSSGSGVGASSSSVDASSMIELQPQLEVLRVVRMMRLFRLLKLFRILRASRIFARWESAITITYSNRELMRYLTIVIVVLHWLACGLGLMAQLWQPQRSSALGDEIAARISTGAPSSFDDASQCFGCVPNDASTNEWCEALCLTPCELDALATIRLQAVTPNPYDAQVARERMLVLKGESWICRFNSHGMVSPPEQHFDVWVAAIYVALVAFSGGVGSIYPENAFEYAFFILGILVGSVIWAMVVGTICAMMSTGDPHTIDYHHDVDQLNSFLKDNDVPVDIGTQCRAYLHSTLELRRKLSHDSLMSRLSPGLAGSIMLHNSKNTFGKVWYLEQAEGECLVQLASRLTRHGYPPKERMPSTELNILSRGIAARGGDLLYGGMSWGTDIILNAVVLRDNRPITALTYVEVQSLSRENLYDVLRSYPESARVVQNAAVRMALKRTVVLLKAYADSQAALAAETAAASAPSATNTSAAYTMLTAAFSGDQSRDVPDGMGAGMSLGSIFRIITGEKLRDVDEEGHIIEKVANAPSAEQEAAHARAVEDSAMLKQSMARMQNELDSIQSGMKGMESMLKQLVSSQGKQNGK